MRKRDVFGKKVDTQKPLYYIFIIFAVAIIGYFTINSLQTNALLKLQEEQSQIQTSINNTLYLNQESKYQEVDELLPYLPKSYSEASLFNELQFVKNLTGLSSTRMYQIEFTTQVDSPFVESVDENLNSVMIEVNMEIDDYTNVFDYIDNLDDMDRLYYIDNVSLNLLGDDSAYVSLTIYTFYMSE